MSKHGIEADIVKIEVIEKLHPPVSVKGVQSFLGHAGFYCRFIKDFTKIAKILCALLEKEIPFNFDACCLHDFEMLKIWQVEAPTLISPDWELPLEQICDASDVALGVVLGKHREKVFHCIYYASKALDATQCN